MNYSRRRKKSRKSAYVILIFTLIVVCFTFIYLIRNKQSNDNITAKSETQTNIVSSKKNIQSADNHPMTDAEKKDYILAHDNLYPEEMIEFMMKYDQTIDFVYNYPQHNSKDAISHNVTEDKDDSENDAKDAMIYTLPEAQKGVYPKLVQWDAKWGYEKYGVSYIGVAGCGPTCLSMVYTGLTGKNDISPGQMAKLSDSWGYYVIGVGTSWDLMSKGADKIGLKSKIIGNDSDVVFSELNKGHPLILSVKAGDFTKGGHFIAVTGTKDGKLIINDPNSKTNSNKLWDFSVVSPQIKQIWSFNLD